MALYDVTHEDWPFRLAVNSIAGEGNADRYEIILVNKTEGMPVVVGEVNTEFGNMLLAMKRGNNNVIINGISFQKQIAIQIEVKGGTKPIPITRKREVKKLDAPKPQLADGFSYADDLLGIDELGEADDSADSYCVACRHRTTNHVTRGCVGVHSTKVPCTCKLRVWQFPVEKG